MTSEAMTHDELIEAVARVMCERHIRNVRRHDTEPERLETMMPTAVEYSWKKYVEDARAAIRVIAPAVLEDAAKKAVSFLVGDPMNGVPLHSPSPREISDAIRALKTRYEQ